MYNERKENIKKISKEVKVQKFKMQKIYRDKKSKKNA